MLKEYRKKIFLAKIYPIGYAMLNFNIIKKFVNQGPYKSITDYFDQMWFKFLESSGSPVLSSSSLLSSLSMSCPTPSWLVSSSSTIRFIIAASRLQLYMVGVLWVVAKDGEKDVFWKSSFILTKIWRSFKKRYRALIWKPCKGPRIPSLAGRYDNPIWLTGIG